MKSKGSKLVWNNLCTVPCRSHTDPLNGIIHRDVPPQGGTDRHRTNHPRGSYRFNCSRTGKRQWWSSRWLPIVNPHLSNPWISRANSQFTINSGSGRHPFALWSLSPLELRYPVTLLSLLSFLIWVNIFSYLRSSSLYFEISNERSVLPQDYPFPYFPSHHRHPIDSLTSLTTVYLLSLSNPLNSLKELKSNLF